MGYNIKCSVFGSAMAQLKLCFSFKFNPLWFPFSVFIFQVMLHKRTQKWRGMLLNIKRQEQARNQNCILNSNKLIWSSLLFNLTINRICYLNLSPVLFWILWAKKKTNKQTFSNNCPLLWLIITKYMVYNSLFHQCGKRLSCLSITGKIICKM